MFAAFPVGFFLIGAVVLVALPVGFRVQSYFRNRGRRTVVCPENHEPVTVELDNKFAFKTALRGQENERLQSCSRWPEKGVCGQECLAQINPSPENLERLLQKSYQAKSCAICDRPLSPADWPRSVSRCSMKSRDSSSCVRCILRRFLRLSITWRHFAGTVARKSVPARRSRHGF